MIHDGPEPPAQVATKHLGWCGRLLSWSKSEYRKEHPTHRVFYNANVYTIVDGTAIKLWYGDVDLTADQSTLQALVDELGKSIYITFEQPYRFEEVTVERLEADLTQPCDWCNPPHFGHGIARFDPLMGEEHLVGEGGRRR